MAAVIEEVTSGLKKISKNKNMLVFAVAGAVLGGIVLFKKRGENETGVDLPVDNSSLYPVFNSGNQDTAYAMSEVSQSIADSLQLFSDSQTDILRSVVNEVGNQLSATQTSIIDSSNSIVSQVANVVDQGNYNSPPPVSKPSVTVRSGSIEEQYLRDQYGDSINIVSTSANQFVGETRNETNASYVQYLADKGVTPVNALSNQQLALYQR